MIPDSSSSRLQPLAGTANSSAEKDSSDSTMTARIGSYLLGQRLRESLSGPVMLATHTATGMEVEIKMLPREDMRDEQAELRIKREIGALKRLQHPNVLRVWAVGREGDQPFLVMEHLPGRTLEDWLGELGKLAVTDSLNLHLQVLEGLDAMHKAKLLHRDIQPAHILIGDDGRVVLRGFGLIKFLDPADNGDGTLVNDDAPGTRAALYKAPEQIEDARCTPATDVYAVGVSLYQSLSGQFPFDGPPLEQALARTSMAPASLGERDGTLPAALVSVVDRMIARDPAKRPASARDAAAELKRV